jgi:gentisate 1,2-dioxygenase
MFVYRYDMMRELLEKFRDWDGDRHEALMVEYVDPTSGQSVYKTMTFFMQMLRSGERTLPLKQSASLVCSPFEGRGYSVIGGQRVDWEPFDTFVVPGGTWCEHVNLSDKEPAILFVGSDEPTLKALALYQKHGKNDGGDIVRLF